MITGAPAKVYVAQATSDQRLAVARMVRDALAGMGLLSKETCKVLVKKSTHLYVFDDAYLCAGWAGEDIGAMDFEPRSMMISLRVQVPQWIRAEWMAGEIIHALDTLFAKDLVGYPAFLWRQYTPKFLRSAPGRITSRGEPHHWFIAYELLMPTPDGETTPVYGAIMELRLMPLKDGQWRLLILHIRIPLLAQAVETRYLPAAPTSNPTPRPTPAPNPSIPLSIPEPFGSLQFKPSPERTGTAQTSSPSRPRVSYVVPPEGSNLFAPYYVLADEEGDQLAPATCESARILLDRRLVGRQIVLRAMIAPETGAGWNFTWYYAGLQAGRVNAGAQAIAPGPALVLSDGCYDVDLVATKSSAIGSGTGARNVVTVVRSRRLVSADHAVVEIAPERAQDFVHTHGNADEAQGESRPVMVGTAHSHHES